MASSGSVSGIALAEIAAGLVLAWSGIQNVPISKVAGSFVSGRVPSPGPSESFAGNTDTTSGTGTVPSLSSLPGGTVSGGSGSVTPRQAFQALRAAGFPASAAVTMTAIGGVESTWNTRALNNTPATGDYSVGVWQINYFDGLYAERTALFGPPDELLGNLQKQADAAYILYRQSGFGPWQPDITLGKINAYMAQALAAAGQ